MGVDIKTGKNDDSPNLNEILEEISENTEYLETTQGDEVECISIENLKGILNKYLK